MVSAASDYIESLKIMDNEFMARFFDGQNECVQHLIGTGAGQRRSRGVELSDAVCAAKPDRPLCSDAGRMRSTLFAKRARYLKGSEREAVAMNEYKERILREAREEGVRSVAQRMIELGSIPVTTIAEVLGWPISEVERIARQMQGPDCRPAIS